MYYGFTKEEWGSMSDEKKREYADAHSCTLNAKTIFGGPQGDGDYCTVCGKMVRSIGFDLHEKDRWDE